MFKTKPLKNYSDFIILRKQLIAKAISFVPGLDLEHQEKTIVADISQDTQAVFFKPGKETARANPNKNDMRPAILKNGADITPQWAFQEMWEYLLKISIIQQDAFKKILVVLYRLAYMMDHADGVFAPSAEMIAEINNIDRLVIRPGFIEKFGQEEISLLNFLYFVDLLAWNEDVKYQADGAWTNKNKGRVNTILSILSAPLMISKFIQNIIINHETGRIDVHLITATIQKFTKSRGLCVLPKRDLLRELSPYLSDE